MQSKSDYDKIRYLKIKDGSWKFNPEPPVALTGIQEQILTGGLLGDSHLYQYKNQVNAGLAINRAIKDKDYLTYQFDIFKDFCPSGIKERSTVDKRTGKTYIGCSFRTQVSEAFNPYKQKWYINGNKIVAKDLQLTPLICAIWFCDDGSIVYTGSSKNGRRISLYTDGFIEDDVRFLQSLLYKTINIQFGLAKKNSTKNKDRGFYLFVNKKQDVIDYISYIKNDVPISMSRKSDRWKDYI